MGICTSNKKPLVVRQSSTLKFALQKTQFPLPKSIVSAVAITDNLASTKLKKQESDMNLLPPELQRGMTMQSDESIFEREKRMVVLLVNCSAEKSSQLVLIDVDFQSAGFGRIICRLNLPLPGEELYSFACMRNTHSMMHQDDLDHLLEQKGNQQYTLVTPVPLHSRIYVLNLTDASASVENGNCIKPGFPLPLTQVEQHQQGALLTQMRIQKCITREELSRWDLGAPLCICSNSAGRSSAVPLIIVTSVDRAGHCKGDLLRLDRRTFCPVDRRKRSITEQDRQSSANSNISSTISPSLSANSVIGGFTNAQATLKFPHFGGAIAINLRNGAVFSTEWGNLEKILRDEPRLNPFLGSQDPLDPDDSATVYGSTVNVWDLRKRHLIQTIRLEPPEDATWPICIRMLHHSELTHGFICTAIGSSIYHLHKSTRTGHYIVDRLIKFSSVSVGFGEWPGDGSDVPAFLTDLLISTDDQHLYVCAAFHGFVAQFNITDPFRPTLTQKVFFGGIVHKCMGIVGDGQIPLGKNSAQRCYNTERVKIAGRLFEGGPCRLQMSLDGRRLFVSNAFLSNWDKHFFPQLAEHGSCIALVHVDPSGNKPMIVDNQICINLEFDEPNGTKSTFYAREMRFLNGDSTSDYI